VVYFPTLRIWRPATWRAWKDAAADLANDGSGIELRRLAKAIATLKMPRSSGHTPPSKPAELQCSAT
jgi:hypothetical protein